MKICLLSRFFDLRNAGIGRYSQELLKGLRKRGFEVRTVSQDGGMPLGQGRGKYFVYTSFEIAFKTPSDCDIYHACAPMETLWLGGNKKTVVTFHDLIPMLYLGLIPTHYVKDLFTRVISKNYFILGCKHAIKCNWIIVNNDQTAKELTKYFNVREEKIKLMRYGISPDLKPKAKSDDTYRIGTLSYFDPRKRLDLLIKAFKKANMKDAELIIGGKGTDEQMLKTLAGDDKRIKFLGFVPDEKLCDFYNSLDCFIFPSLLEGYGLPIVEAMACSKPVVTLEDAIIPSDVKSRTHIVKLVDLSEVLKKREFKCDMDANLEFAREHSWEELVNKTVEIYESI
jgi:glycosyltransferase involved in cell wall biosynthesis